MNERMKNTKRRVLAGALSTTMAMGLGGSAAEAQPRVINPDYCPAAEVLRADPGQSLASYCKVALMRTLRQAGLIDVKRPHATSAYKRLVNSLDLNKEDLRVNGELDALTAASILEGKGLEVSSPVKNKRGRVFWVNKKEQYAMMVKNGEVIGTVAVSTGQDEIRDTNKSQRANMFTPEGEYTIGNIMGPNYTSTSGADMGSAHFWNVPGTNGMIYAVHRQVVPLTGEPLSHGCVRVQGKTMEKVVAPFLKKGDTVITAKGMPVAAKRASRNTYYSSINSTSTSTSSSPAPSTSTTGGATTSTSSNPR